MITDSHIKRTLGLRLRSRKTPSCVLADISGMHTQSMIDAVLEGGIPAAVWWRGGAPHPEDPDARAELTRLLALDDNGQPTTNVLTLPQQVHELRLDGATGSRITLLWDDPDCTVETRSLHS